MVQKYVNFREGGEGGGRRGGGEGWRWGGYICSMFSVRINHRGRRGGREGYEDDIQFRIGRRLWKANSMYFILEKT